MSHGNSSVIEISVFRNFIARIAVPFYFISSGYFLFRKTDIADFDKSIPLKYAKRIFRLYALWSIIYLPLAVRGTVWGDEKGKAHGCLLLLRNIIFTGSFEHLWYLNATIFAVLLLTLLLSKGVKLNRIITAAFILYLIGLIPQTYTVLLEPIRANAVLESLFSHFMNIIVTTRNGLFEGFLFMAIGALFAYVKIDLSYKKALVGFAVSFVLFGVEAFVIAKLGWAENHEMYLLLVPVSFFMFYLAAKTELKPSPKYKTLRIMSSLIFYSHFFFLRILEKAFEIIGEKTGIPLNSFIVLYVSVCVSSIIFSYLYYKLSEKKYFAFLKLLYS